MNKKKEDYFLSDHVANQRDKETYALLAKDNPMYGCRNFDLCAIPKCPLDNSGQGFQLYGKIRGSNIREPYCPVYFKKSGKKREKQLIFLKHANLAIIIAGTKNPTAEDILMAKKT